MTQVALAGDSEILLQPAGDGTSSYDAISRQMSLIIHQSLCSTSDHAVRNVGYIA